MNCRNCGHQNSAESKFCSQCGNALSYPCPNCGTEAEAADRFCRNCGVSLEGTSASDEGTPSSLHATDDLGRYLPEELLAKLRSAREGNAMHGERRTVTMLFADVQGSTSSAETLDPEDWAEIMNGAFERLIAPIYRYEGTLAQLRGDAVLAFFGAPIAHEDDPVRALRAGLEIVESTSSYSDEVERRWGVPAHVRVGINTGLVVVGAMGSDLRVEYTALGDAINVAARMEQTADPDTVRVTGHTLSLTGGVFETEALGNIEVKGKTEAVPAFRVMRYVGRGGSAGSTPEIVGRAREIEKLMETMEDVRHGSGRIVSVIADGGVGKSRLLDEFTHRSADQVGLVRRFDGTGEVSWLRGTSRSYDSERPYSTFADLVTSWWSLEGADDPFGHVAAACEAIGVDDPDVPGFLAHIAGVSLPDAQAQFIESLETQVLNAKVHAATITYIRALASERPTIVVLEDLHWSDTLSLALVESVMAVCEETALGLVLAMRPYRDEPSWQIHEVAGRDHPHRYETLTLHPLSQSDSVDLLERFIDPSVVEPSIRQGILERSQGNPLYIEQMARALGELGAGPLAESELPTSLRGLLTARLDRLQEQQRYHAQLASVLGSEFHRATLGALTDTSDLNGIIVDLLRAGILIERPDRPGTLAFRHALIQEAAYETILKRTRRELHQRVAGHLVDTQAAPAEIARHLIAADDPQSAYPYLVQAGVGATRAMALADAINLLQTAIDNTPDDADPELIVLAHDTLGDAYALIPDLSAAAASYQRLLEYGEDNQRPDAQVSALNRLGYATASLGADFEKAMGYLSEARRIAEENNDELGLADYHMNACFVASLAGDPRTAVAHDEETVRIGDEQGVGWVRLMGMVRRATNYMALLDWENGDAAVEAALNEARAVGYDEAVASVQASASAPAKFMRGEIRASLEETREATRTLERYGSFFVGMARRQQGICHFELGEIEEALSQFLEVSRIGKNIGQGFTAATGQSGMALVYAIAGMPGQIAELEQEALAYLDGPVGEFLASTVLADLGFVNLLVGDLEKAHDICSRGLGASSTTQYFERPRLLCSRAMSSIATGRLPDAENDILEARSFVEDRQLSVYRPLVGLAEGFAAMRDGDPDRATSSLTAAEEHAMAQGQRLILVDILLAMSQVSDGAGNSDQAAGLFERAQSTADAIAGDIADDQLRSSYLNAWNHAPHLPWITQRGPASG